MSTILPADPSRRRERRGISPLRFPAPTMAALLTLAESPREDWKSLIYEGH
jgi:hypothetical protein